MVSVESIDTQAAFVDDELEPDLELYQK